MRIARALIALACLASAMAQAQHSHGEARLDVAIDKNRLSIGLEMPLDVAVGFERAPRNDKEKAALEAARKLLSDPGLFLPTPAANCRAEAPIVKMPEPGKSAADQHADIDADFVYICANPGALRSIETQLFKSLPRLYRIEARRAGPTGQAAARLSPKNATLAW